MRVHANWKGDAIYEFRPPRAWRNTQVNMQGVHGSLWRRYRYTRTMGGSYWHDRPRRSVAFGIALHHWLGYR